jgi:hypothetical protein
MHGDDVRPPHGRLKRGLHRIRLATSPGLGPPAIPPAPVAPRTPIPRLPQRRHMIDVDTKVDHAPV